MQRRDFLRLLIGTAIAEAVDVEKLLWTPKPIITVPGVPFISTGQIIAEEWEKAVQSVSSLYGIPYHQYLGSDGTWLGLTRSEVPFFSSQWNKHEHKD